MSLSNFRLCNTIRKFKRTTNTLESHGQRVDELVTFSCKLLLNKKVKMDLKSNFCNKTLLVLFLYRKYKEKINLTLSTLYLVEIITNLRLGQSTKMSAWYANDSTIRRFRRDYCDLDVIFS